MVKTQRLSAYGLVVHEGFVLLSKLNRGSNIGKWNLVGGGIEHGEAPLEALQREIFEEAGLAFPEEPKLLTVLSSSQMFSTPDGEKENFHLIGIIYLIRSRERLTPKPGGDGESSLGCEWFEIATLQSNQVVSFVTQSLAFIS